MTKQNTGNIIAARRKELGMTQLELAEKMNVTDKAVSKWERNLSCPDIGSLPQLAEIFGMSVDELMQCKPQESALQESEAKKIIALILKVIPLAMGAAVTALSAMGQLDLQSGFGLLGIGLFAVGLSQLQEK